MPDVFDSAFGQAIALAGCGTLGASPIEVEALAVAAHPANLACWVAHEESVVRYVPSDDAASADERPASDGAASDDGTVGAQCCTAKYARRCEFGAVYGGARVANVRKYATGAEEYFVFEYDSVVKANVVLYSAAIADDDAGGDEHILTQDAAVADAGARHNVAEMPDLRVLTDTSRLIDDGCGVNVHEVSCGHGPGFSTAATPADC